MNTQRAMNLVLVCSLLLNILLTASIFWLGDRHHEAMLDLMAANADEQIKLQEKILKDLSPLNLEKARALTNSLQWNIDAQKRVRFKTKTEALP